MAASGISGRGELILALDGRVDRRGGQQLDGMNRGGEVAGMKVGDGIGGQKGEIGTVAVNWETGLEAEQGISEQWRPVSSLNVGDGTRTVVSTNRVNASSDSSTVGQPGMISALGGPPGMNSGSTFGAHSGMHSAMGGPAGMYAGEQLGLPSVDMEDPWGLLSIEVEGPRGVPLE